MLCQWSGFAPNSHSHRFYSIRLVDSYVVQVESCTGQTYRYHGQNDKTLQTAPKKTPFILLGRVIDHWAHPFYSLIQLPMAPSGGLLSHYSPRVRIRRSTSCLCVTVFHTQSLTNCSFIYVVFDIIVTLLNHRWVGKYSDWTRRPNR